jgi:TATA-box binding protein (TBP) (component of TFIID and TFIIIB)
MPKFGLTSAEARQLFVDCAKSVNSIKFAELRREEMQEYGATHPMFIEIVKEFDANPKVTDYKSAEPRYQEALRNIYVTRELMNTHLESLNRKNWLWRFFNRAQIKAAQNYVNAADGLLSKVKFPEDLKEPTMTAATTQGIRAGYSDVDDGLKQIDQDFAEADKAVEARNAEKLQKEEDRRKQKEQRQKEKEEQEKQKKEADEKAKIEKEERHANRKLREEEAKKAIVGHEAEIRAEAEALAKAKKQIPDAFFDIRFRPSWDPVESKRQSDLCVEIGKNYILGKKDLPAGVKAVFEANYNKLRAVRNFVKDFNKLKPVELQNKFKEIDIQFACTEEMVKIEHAREGINYEPITFDQLKLQHDLAKELKSSELKNAQQPKEPAPTELKKEDISKNI